MQLAFLKEFETLDGKTESCACLHIKNTVVRVITNGGSIDVYVDNPGQATAIVPVGDIR